MKSITKKPPRRRLPESERRAQILEAALRVAMRDGLAAVTARSVAKEAGLSQGLVFFHFASADGLLEALVANVTEATLAAAAPPEAYQRLPAKDRFGAFLADRLVSLDEAGARRILELLVEAWVVGMRTPTARRSVREAAERYRATLLPVAQAAIAAQPERFHGVRAEALSSLALSAVLGTAIQATIDPDGFDRTAVRAALLAVFGVPGEDRAPRSQR